MSKAEIYNKAVVEYNYLSTMIEKLYDHVINEKYNILSKEFVLDDLDLYIQCFLLNIALADNKTTNLEIQFIEKIVKHHNYMNHINLEKILKDVEAKDNLLQEINLVLSRIPYFVKLAKMNDDFHLDGNEVPCGEVVVNCLINIASAVSMIDNKVDKVETMTTINDLKPILAYVTKEEKTA